MTVDVVVCGPPATGLGEMLPAGLHIVVVDDPAPAVFHGDIDRWRIGDLSPRVLIDTAPDQGVRTGLIAADDAGARFGVHPYLGLTRHGFPNLFTVADGDAVHYVAQCLRALWRRGHTRVEVKPHVQAQHSRDVDTGIVRIRRKNRRTPDLADYEFTSARDREEDDEDYRGPAVLIGDDGTEVDVRVHVLAVFQPVDNAVRWSGRVHPSAGLAGLHRTLNQPVRIRIGEHEPVDAVLVDHDPWGGSHIVGEGCSPYPMPLLAELTRFDG